MGVIAWSRNPDDNGYVDPLVPAGDGISARDYQRGKRGIMAAVKRLVDDQGGALVSTGVANSYAVHDYSGTEELRAGITFAFTPNRDNDGPASLALNGLGAIPLLDRNGADLVPGSLKKGRLVRVVYDEKGEAWRTADLGLVANSDLASGPEGTLKGNTGDGVADLTSDAARTLLAVDRLPNKSEAEMVAEGAIADEFGDIRVKLSTTATANSVAALTQAVAGKATPDDIKIVVEPVKDRLAIVESGQKNSRISRALYSELVALTLDGATTYESLEKTGTHAGIASEVGYDGGQVPNGGIFIAQGSPLALRRIGDKALEPAAAVDVEAGISNALAATPASLKPFLDRLATEIAERLSLVKQTASKRFTVRNAAGFSVLSIVGHQVRLAGVRVNERLDGRSVWRNAAGFSVFSIGKDHVRLPGCKVRERSDGKVVLRNSAGFGFTLYNTRTGASASGGSGGTITPPSTLPNVTPYFTGPSGTLCGVAGEPLTIYVRNILAVRSDTNRTIATLEPAAGLPPPSSTSAITIDPSKVGASATLLLRPEAGDASTQTALPMAVKAAAKYPVGTGPQGNVLLFGDSIVNRNGPTLLQQYLREYGYRPTMIGTMADNTLGTLGEGRESHESGDATYSITDRALIVPPGEEAAYLALNSAGKREYVPWLRAATGSDPASIIRNGYVMDFAFYQTRFGLATPDVVLWGYGTNNVRDRSEAEIYGLTLADYKLIIARLRAAWPNAVIILYCPGTSKQPSRDAKWTNAYVPMLRAFMDAKIAAADPKVYLAPAWGLAPNAVGYPRQTVSTDATTGALLQTMLDGLHPEGAAQRGLYSVPAAYAACGLDGLL